MIKLIKYFEPSLGTQEKAYRQHHLKEDENQVFAFVLISTVLNSIFLAIEIWIFNQQKEVFILYLIRGAFVALSVCFLIFLKRNKEIIFFDVFAFVWMLSLPLMSFLIRLVHTSDINATYVTYIIDLSIIFCLFLIISTTLLYRTFAVMLLTLSSLFNLFVIDQHIEIPHKITIALMLISMSIFAFIASSRIYNYRRNQYVTKIRTEKLIDELKLFAKTDFLTGITNRREFIRRLDDECKKYSRYQNTFSLAIFDLDKLKMINDQLGHHAGDIVLKKVCEIVSMTQRETDHFGRLGGDEFGLILPFTLLKEAVSALNRIKKMIHDEVVLVDGHQIQMAVSIGVVEINGEDKEPDDLVRRADEFLYQAKRMGGGRIESSIVGE